MIKINGEEENNLWEMKNRNKKNNYKGKTDYSGDMILGHTSVIKNNRM